VGSRQGAKAAIVGSGVKEEKVGRALWASGEPQDSHLGAMQVVSLPASLQNHPGPPKPATSRSLDRQRSAVWQREGHRAGVWECNHADPAIGRGGYGQRCNATLWFRPLCAGIHTHFTCGAETCVATAQRQEGLQEVEDGSQGWLEAREEEFVVIFILFCL
jgi:hypothetical protein